MATPHPLAPANHLLTLLPEAELGALHERFERVRLDFRQIVYDVSTPIEHVYFPVDGVISLIGVTADGAAVEVATVGNEGMVGLPVFLGAKQVLGQAFAQVPGAALRIEAAAFLAATATGKLRDVIHLYTLALFTQVAQAAACNRLHLTEERFARWLLMTHDRVGKDEFALTQDFLSQMLGVRRATVSQIASKVQADGVIRYVRGCMTIVDRARLEGMTCECYEIIRAEFERLLGKPRNVPSIDAPVPLPPLSHGGLSTAQEAAPREHHDARPKQRPRS